MKNDGILWGYTEGNSQDNEEKGKGEKIVLGSTPNLC